MSSPIRTGVAIRAAAALASGALLALVGVTAAEAAPTSSALRVVSTTTSTNAACVAQITAARKAGTTAPTTDVCTRTSTLSEGAASTVTAADLVAAKGTLSTSQFDSLAAAAAVGTVKKATFKQTQNNITDGEEQYGYVYYDGARVWISSYRGYTGQHICKVDWAVGYAVGNTGCGDSGSPSSRSIYQKWNFAVGVKGSPVAWEEVYTIHATATGALSQ